MSKDLVTVDGMDLVGELTSKTTMFCSMVTNTPEEKVKFFNAMNNPEHRLADCINKTIMARDIFCEIVSLTKKDSDGADVLDENGDPVVVNCPRIVIIDKDNAGYGCVSMGIFNAVKKIIAVYGPPTWVDNIPIEVKQITKGQRKFLTLNIVDTSKK